MVGPHPSPTQPLLKWAGGKRQLLPTLRQYYPARLHRYIEPFFGSGAVFFDLISTGRLAGRHAWLVDDNPDLVGCYAALRDQPEAVIEELALLEVEHRTHQGLYYDVRDRRFNPMRATGSTYTPALAAMLIYLNRTGFNGLFRVNRRGAFNVPEGRYVNPRICKPDHLRAVASALGSPEVRLEHGSFDGALCEAGSGDFVYCDPPYAPLSATSRFAQYTADGFDTADQTRLQRLVTEAAGRGAMVLLSNSSAPVIEELYGTRAVREAGLTLMRVPARRAINARASSRGAVDEVLVVSRALALNRVTRPAPVGVRAPRRAVRTA